MKSAASSVDQMRPEHEAQSKNDETIAVRSLSHIQTFYCREVSDVDAASNTIQFLKYSSLALVDGRTRLRHHHDA